jgi:hypothetical protein
MLTPGDVLRRLRHLIPPTRRQIRDATEELKAHGFIERPDGSMFRPAGTTTTPPEPPA